ncbi:hypothetical protein HOY80DRAFT_324360, partial [Tuber brumale]
LYGYLHAFYLFLLTKFTYLCSLKDNTSTGPTLHLQGSPFTHRTCPSPTGPAGHFSLWHESLWVHYNYGRWITDIDAAIGSPGINSPQNGFLLQPTIHQMFDRYLVSVNPDDGYRVVVFTINFIGCDGRILDPACQNPADPHRVSDNLLRWHFRQSILANMRGAGELIFEHDFPPWTDTAGKVLAGLDSQARSEWVIATGLREVS